MSPGQGSSGPTGSCASSGPSAGGVLPGLSAWARCPLTVGPCCLFPGPGPLGGHVALASVLRPAPALRLRRGWQCGRRTVDTGRRSCPSPWRGLQGVTGCRAPGRAALNLQSRADPETTGRGWTFHVSWAWPAAPGGMAALVVAWRSPKMGSHVHRGAVRKVPYQENIFTLVSYKARFYIFRFCVNYKRSFHKFLLKTGFLCLLTFFGTPFKSGLHTCSCWEQNSIPGKLKPARVGSVLGESCGAPAKNSALEHSTSGF